MIRYRFSPDELPITAAALVEDDGGFSVVRGTIAAITLALAMAGPAQAAPIFDDQSLPLQLACADDGFLLFLPDLSSAPVYAAATIDDGNGWVSWIGVDDHGPVARAAKQAPPILLALCALDEWVPQPAALGFDDDVAPAQWFPISLTYTAPLFDDVGSIAVVPGALVEDGLPYLFAVRGDPFLFALPDDGGLGIATVPTLQGFLFDYFTLEPGIIASADLEPAMLARLTLNAQEEQ